MNRLKWEIKSFNRFTLDELYDVLKLRVDVFVVEQNCPYPELDEKDKNDESVHLIGKNNRLKVCAYSRLLPPGVSYPQASIGRVVVDKDHRGAGISREMLTLAIETIEQYWPGTDIKIGAQTYLEEFYASFGFKKASEHYLEDGIPHLDMILKKN